MRALPCERVGVALAGVAADTSRAWVVPSFHRVAAGAVAELSFRTVVVRHADEFVFCPDT